MTSETKSGQHSYHELIDFHKAISLLSLEEISAVLVDRLPPILSIDYFTLFIYDQDKRTLNLMCHNRPDIESSFSLPLSDSPIMEAAILSGKYILEESFIDSKYYRESDSKFFKKDYFATIPLKIEKEIMGVLNINDGEQVSFNVSNLHFVLKLSEFISMTVSNAILYEKAKKLSVTDGLTGISNRPKMEQTLQSEFERSMRYGSPLAVVLLDVDHFKVVNDTYGHQKGDEILLAFASLLKKFCRANDVAARYGGEEFLMILPQSNAQGAFKIAERVREEMMKLNFTGQESNFNVTTSCGVAELDRDDMKSADQLISAADHALYEAKNSGRNKTIIGSVEKKKKK